MALTQEQTDTILDRMRGGERLPHILRDMEISQEDAQEFREANRGEIRQIRRDNRPPDPDPPSTEERIARLQARRARLQSRIARIDAELAELQS